MTAKVLILACGALAHELVALKRRNAWAQVDIRCLPAELHNTPRDIPGAVSAAIDRYRADYDHLFVAYGDCGTGGLLDRVLEDAGVERLAGAHCYGFFAGPAFDELADEEPGTFFLTDFLARHFDRLVKRGLALDRHPELRDAYFGNYRRLVYLAQTDSEDLDQRARAAADFLGLAFERHRTGLTPLELQLKEQVVAWRS